MTDDSDINPEALAKRRREFLLEMTPEGFLLWQHHPVTAAFFQYLDDLIIECRNSAADLLEAGAYRLGDTSELRNPDVVRGRILAVRDLHRITLADIQGLYGKETPLPG